MIWRVAGLGDWNTLRQKTVRTLSLQIFPNYPSAEASELDVLGSISLNDVEHR